MIHSSNTGPLYIGSPYCRCNWAALLIQAFLVRLFRRLQTLLPSTGYIDASKVEGKKATVNLHTILHNANKRETVGNLYIQILSPQGKDVYSTTKQVNIAGEGSTPLSLSFEIKKPELWSVDSPHLYTARISVRSEQQESDQITVPFGIRAIEFSAKEGFLLNGKPLKLKGGCLHHDNGLLGAAAFDRAEERKVELMKANGFNAVRCSHNLPSEYFLQACDRLDRKSVV